MQRLTTKQINARRGRRNKLVGGAAEQIVAHRLRAMGFMCVVKLHTGWVVKRVKGRMIVVRGEGTVSGDFRAVTKAGQSVHVECKMRKGVLRLSDFARHNRDALTEHELAGGLSLVAWVNPGHGVAIFSWGALAVGKLRSVPWEMAQAMGREEYGPVQEQPLQRFQSPLITPCQVTPGGE